MRKLAYVTALFLTLSMLFAACSGGGATPPASTTPANDQGTPPAVVETPAATNDEVQVRKVTFGMRTDLPPNAYIDETGNKTGQNVEVMMAVDELLTKYEFEYDPVDTETILIGIDTGKYAGGLGNYFWNAEREEKYLFPREPVSAGVRGMIMRKEYEGNINSLSDFAVAGLSVVPPAISESAYNIYNNWNNENPDNQIKFDIGEGIPVGESVRMIMEGRYDGAVFLRNNYDSVKEELDPNDETFFLPFTGVMCWVLYNPAETELVEAIDEAIRTLHENGTMGTLSEKWYGEDVFQYVSDQEHPSDAYKKQNS